MIRRIKLDAVHDRNHPIFMHGKPRVGDRFMSPDGHSRVVEVWKGARTIVIEVTPFTEGEIAWANLGGTI